MADVEKVESAQPGWHYIDLFRLVKQGGTRAQIAKRIAPYVAAEVGEAIIAQSAALAKVQAERDEAMGLLREVREQRAEPATISTFDGVRKKGAGWSISGLTALLPRINTLLKGTPDV